MRTAELTGAALDWAVAQCEGLAQGQIAIDGVLQKAFAPSTNWAQGGPIIAREGINLDNYAKNPQWSAWIPVPERDSGEAQAYGLTPLIAAMRCYVVAHLGDEVYVPDELK